MSDRVLDKIETVKDENAKSVLYNIYGKLPKGMPNAIACNLTDLSVENLVDCILDLQKQVEFLK